LEESALGRSKETKKLETVLFTLLRISEEEVAKIKKARKKATGYFGGYFGSSKVGTPLDIKPESKMSPKAEFKPEIKQTIKAEVKP